jgi:hypothetical protein
MEGGQIALFFVQSIFDLVQGVAVLKTIYIFDYHLKPIRMKHLLTFVAQAIAAAVVVWAYLWTLQIFGL